MKRWPQELVWILKVELFLQSKNTMLVFARCLLIIHALIWKDLQNVLFSENSRVQDNM